MDVLEILRNGGGSPIEDSIIPKMIKTSATKKKIDSIITSHKTRINQVKQIMSQINDELTSVVTKKTAEGEFCKNEADNGANKKNNTSKAAPNLTAQVIISFIVAFKYLPRMPEKNQRNLDSESFADY